MDNDPIRRAIAGSIGGLVEACLLQPIDMIKTRMQLRPSEYQGFLRSGRRIVADESVKALWKGLTPFAAHLTTKYALRFGANAWLAHHLADDHGKLSWPRRLLAGFGAGALEAAMIVCPFDVVKIRVQQSRERLPTRSVLRDIIQNEGPRALWTGVGVTMARNGLQQATMFLVKSKVDELMRVGPQKRPWESMASGTLAAVPGMCLTNPLDVIKTKLAMEPGQRAWVVAKSIWRSSGVKGFYRGLGPRLMRVPPGMGIVWMVVDAF